MYVDVDMASHADGADCRCAIDAVPRPITGPCMSMSMSMCVRVESVVSTLRFESALYSSRGSAIMTRGVVV